MFEASLFISNLNAFLSFAAATLIVVWACRRLFTSYREDSFGFRCVAEQLIFICILVSVLTRGASHNNAWLDYLYANNGLRGLLLPLAYFGAVVVSTFYVLLRRDAWMGGSVLMRRTPLRNALSGKVSIYWLIFILSVVAILGALGPVFKYWDVQGWGDSSSYEGIAFAIARGIKPFGESYYMPIYQFGLAGVYSIFGHFYFVQQIVNVLMAGITVLSIAGTAYIIFQNRSAVLLVGLAVAFNDRLRHMPYATQIENWYIPAVACGLFAATFYLQKPSIKRLVLLVLAAAVIFNMRGQGAFTSGVLLLTPVFVRSLPVLDRAKHLLLIGLLFGVTMLPWSYRNYVVEDRFSPKSDQGAIFLAVMNDPRIGLYGLRYNIGRSEIMADWQARYPDVNERKAAMEQYFFDRLLHTPEYFLEAAPWRLMAFYGIAPPGAWAPEGPRPTHWRSELTQYVFSAHPPMVLILASVLGLMLGFGRMALFYSAVIVGSFSLAFLVGFGEPRLSYPILPIHVLLAAMGLFPLARQTKRLEEGGRQKFPLTWQKRTLLIGGVGSAALLSYMYIGNENIYRDHRGLDVANIGPVEMDDTLPMFDGEMLPQVGDAVRLKGVVLNTGYPEKVLEHGSNNFPLQLMVREGRQYYKMHFVDKSDEKPCERSECVVGVSFDDATVSGTFAEHSFVDVQGHVAIVKDDRIWLDAQQVLVIHSPDPRPRHLLLQ